MPRIRLPWPIRPDLLALALLLLQLHGALLWIAGTWTDDTYQSLGFLALIVLVVRQRRLPPLRAEPSRPHLVGLVVAAALELVAARLGINILSALLAVVALHLWAVTFRRYEGRWFLQPQLLLALLCLPAAFWLNVLCGHQLQQLVARAAAAGLGLYGLPTAGVDGTLIQIGGTAIAVDSACSGVKLLVSGLVFGLLAQPRGGLARRALFWAGLGVLLLGANVARVMSLSLAHLRLGQPPGEVVHQAIGLAAFVMACGGALLVGRWLGRGTRHRPAEAEA
jgi:exosortase